MLPVSQQKAHFFEGDLRLAKTHRTDARMDEVQTERADAALSALAQSWLEKNHLS